MDRDALLDLLPVLIDTLGACQNVLTAAVQKDGQVNLDLASACAMLAGINRNQLQRILDREAQKEPADRGR